MRSLVEWSLSISLELRGRGDAWRGVADSVMQAITRWADQRRYGLGGGYAKSARGVAFDLGVCVTRDGDIIPEDEMRELVLVAVREMTSLGLRGTAEFREFTDEEAGPANLDKLVDDALRKIN